MRRIEAAPQIAAGEVRGSYRAKDPYLGLGSRTFQLRAINLLRAHFGARNVSSRSISVKHKVLRDIHSPKSPAISRGMGISGSEKPSGWVPGSAARGPLPTAWGWLKFPGRPTSLVSGRFHEAAGAHPVGKQQGPLAEYRILKIEAEPVRTFLKNVQFRRNACMT